MQPYLYQGDVRECPCGCGRTFSAIGSRGRERRYFSPACSLRVNRVSGGGEGRRHTDETRAVLSEKARRPKPWLRGERNGMHGRTGPLNPNWKGGGSPDRQRLYASSEWRRLRRQLRARANGRCEDCGATTDLHAHHIKSWAEHPALRLELSNLRLLCRACHYATHAGGGEANE